MTPGPDPSGVHQMTGAYAVHALGPEQTRRFEQHLPGCTSCRREVAELTDTAALLGQSVARRPSTALRDQVLAAARDTVQVAPVAPEAPRRPTGSAGTPVADTTPPAPSHDPDAASAGGGPAPSPRVRSWWHRATTRRVRPMTAVALGLVMLAGGATLGAALGDPAPASPVVAGPTVGDGLRSWTASSQGTTLRVVHTDAGHTWVLGSDLPALAPGRTYQLWLLRESGPQPVGTVTPDEAGTLSRAVDAPLIGATAVAVTVEPVGGSTAPSSEPWIVVPL